MKRASVVRVAALCGLWFSCGQAPVDSGLDDQTFVDPDATVAEELTASSVSLSPVADAMVRSGASAGTNFGATASLRTDGDASGDALWSYLRFNVGPQPGKISRAVLRCYVTNGSTNAFDVTATQPNWSETTITWDHRPASSGGAVGSVAKIGSGAWASVDVTAAVSANATVSLALSPPTTDAFACNAKEASSRRPALVLTVDASTVSVVQPAVGSAVSGTVVLAALVNGAASPTDAARVEFVIDGVTHGPATIGLGWNLVFDTTTLANGSHSIFARATDAAGNVSTSAASTFTISNLVLPAPAVVTVAQPAAGATVSGTAYALAALVNGSASAADGSRVDFLLDGQVYGPAALGLGWNVFIDSTRLANGAHSLVARLVDPYGRTLSSAGVSFTVNNPADTWANHLGISLSADKTNLDKARALGVTWVRFGWEMGWGAFDDSLITYAHSLGLKVLWGCQKSTNGLHTYADADVPAFAAYCAAWVDKGVDAIEIGNEWNHRPFYLYNGGDPDSTYVSQAKFFDATTAAIRARSATIPIMNGGWSPEASPNLPQEAMLKVLANSTTFKSQGTLIAHHPYAYNCDSPLACGYPGRKDWNAFLATQDVYAAARSQGYDHPVWMTEIGGPSGNGNNLYGGAPFTPQTQAQLFKDYFTGVGVLRGAGVPIGVLFFHSIQDGQSFTNAEEQTFGVYDQNWVLKPAGQVLKAQTTRPW